MGSKESLGLVRRNLSFDDSSPAALADNGWHGNWARQTTHLALKDYLGRTHHVIPMRDYLDEINHGMSSGQLGRSTGGEVCEKWFHCCANVGRFLLNEVECFLNLAVIYLRQDHFPNVADFSRQFR